MTDHIHIKAGRSVAMLLVLVGGIVFLGACSGGGSETTDDSTFDTLAAAASSDELAAETAALTASASDNATSNSSSVLTGVKRGVLPSSIGPENSLLKVNLQGADEGNMPLKNGGAIRLEEDLTAEIFIDPYPTDTLTAWVDLFLRTEAGEPVTDARVVIDYDMFSMAHGPFFSLAEKSLDGHYVFRLDYIMFGPWGQLLQVKSPDSGVEHKLELTIVAVP